MISTPPSRKYPKMQKHIYVPTLTNEQIKEIPIWQSSVARNIRLTEKGLAAIKEGDKA